jgi:hypothetical protein
MYGLIVRNICEYFTQLEQLPADALQQHQQHQQDAQQAAEDADRMDTDGAVAGTPAGQGSAAAAAAADAAKAVMLRSVLRHCFTLLSMLTAAQPSLLDPQFVPALLEVGFSPKLAVSWRSQQICYGVCRTHGIISPHTVLQQHQYTDACCMCDAHVPEFMFALPLSTAHRIAWHGQHACVYGNASPVICSETLQMTFFKYTESLRLAPRRTHGLRATPAWPCAMQRPTSHPPAASKQQQSLQRALCQAQQQPATPAYQVPAGTLLSLSSCSRCWQRLQSCWWRLLQLAWLQTGHLRLRLLLLRCMR